MAIIGGVRYPVGWLMVGGASVPALHAEAVQTAKRTTGSYTATVALDTLGMSPGDITGDMDGGVGVSLQNGGGDITPLVVGPIKNVEVDYEQRTVIIHGQDNSSKLHEQKSSEKFTNQTPQQIIQTVAGRVGLSAVVSSASSLLAGKITQIEWAKMTDDISLGSIVDKMCEFLGSGWSVSGSTLTVFDAGAAAGGYAVVYQAPSGGPASGNFLKLTVTRNLPLSKSISVTTSSWSSHEKKKYTSTKTISGSGGPLQFSHVIPNLQQDHVDQHAKSAADNYSRHEISVCAEMVGDPSIDILGGLSLSGTDFDGAFDIDEIVHSISDHGYTMKIEAKGRASGRSSSGSDTVGSGAGSQSFPLPITGG